MSCWKALVAVIPVLIFAAPAHAQFGPFKPKLPSVPKVADPADGWRQAMNKVNSLSQEGLRELPGLIDDGDDPGKVKTKLEKAKKKYDEAKKYYATVPDPKSVNEGATGYYLSLEAGVNNGYLALACLQAQKPIAKSFGEGKPVKDDKLDAFDKAAAAYAERAIGEDGAREAKRWVDQAASFRELNPQVAEKKLKGELNIKRAAEEKAEKDAMDALMALLKSWPKVVEDDTQPVPAAELAAYDAHLATLVGFRAEAPRYFDDKKWDFLVYNAWFLGGDLARDELARLWGAAVESSGTTSAKTFKVSVKAQADHCYAVVPHWLERGGKVELDLDWHAKKDAAYAHMWSMQKPRARGFCANKAMTVELAGALRYAGSNQGIEYHVLRWEKAKLPMTVAARLHSWPTDDCDPTHWKDHFMNPIPGTFYYGDGLPVVGGKHPDGGDGGGSGVAPPPAWKFEEGWMAPGSFSSWRTRCGGEDTINPLGKQLEACFIANDKSFQPKYDAAQKAVERATYVTHDGAVARRDAIDQQWAKAQETRCMPIAKKITAQMIAAYDELVDWFKQTAPVPALDVKGFQKQQDLAVERGQR